jgi:hypothetical protein
VGFVVGKRAKNSEIFGTTHIKKTALELFVPSRAQNARKTVMFEKHPAKTERFR